MKLIRTSFKVDSRPNRLSFFWLATLSLILINSSLALRIAHAVQVTLAWDANTEPKIAGYRLYYGTSSRAYEHTIDVGNVTTYTVMNLSNDWAYYFAATAYDVYGNESKFSEEITYEFASQNKPPVAHAGPDQSAQAGTWVVLDGTKSKDPEGDPLSYEWTLIKGRDVALLDMNSVQSIFVAPYIGPMGSLLTFKLTVTDSGGLQSVDTCCVNVSTVNYSPLGKTGPDQTLGPKIR